MSLTEEKEPFLSSTTKDALPVLPVWCSLPVITTLRTANWCVAALSTMVLVPRKRLEVMRRLPGLETTRGA